MDLWGQGWWNTKGRYEDSFAEDPGHAAVINTQTNRLNLMWFVDNIDEIFSALKQGGVGIERVLYPGS